MRQKVHKTGHNLSEFEIKLNKIGQQDSCKELENNRFTYVLDPQLKEHKTV